MAKAESELELTREETLQYYGFLIALRANLQEAFLQYQDGRLDADYFEARAGSTVSGIYFRNTAARDAYQAWKAAGAMTAEFEEWFEQALLDAHGPLYDTVVTQ